MRVFVTGGTGLLGRNLIEALSGEHHAVVALVRSLDRARPLLPESAQLVEGDLTDRSSYAESLTDVDAVVHAGACYGEFYRGTRSRGELQDVNVKGTLKLLQASLDRAVRRFVYISSAGVLQTNEGTATNESASYSTAGDGAYFESKIDAEKQVLSFAGAHPEMQIVTLLPTAMLGPNDTGPTPTGAVLKRVVAGKANIVFPGAMNVVDARDVAAAAIAALTRGQSGARYVLGGTRLSVREIFAQVTAAVGRPAPTKTPPPAMLKLMIGVRGLVARLQRKRPPLRPADINRLQRDFWFDSSAAKRDLGASFRPLRETLVDTAQSLLDDAN